MPVASQFDVLILGTGLAESITAAALSKSGFRVLHVDTNAFYGSSEASLTTEEVVQWSETINAIQDNDKLTTHHSLSCSSNDLASPRSYSLSIAPSIIPSSGPLITSLISSGVARYGGFKLLENVSIYSSSGFRPVPGSKEEIFKARDISLIDKRRLMRFLVFASGAFESSPELLGKEDIPFPSFLEESFSLTGQLATAISYAIALCTTSYDTALPALVRTRQYLTSAGRYGPSPFLIGQYGGLGELAQGFCRICAVSGGTYILGREVLAIHTSFEDKCAELGHIHSLHLDGVEETLSARLVISPPGFLKKFSDLDVNEAVTSSEPDSIMICGLAIIDGPLVSISSQSCEATQESSGDIAQSPGNASIDTALLVYPPGELSGGQTVAAVNVLINGEGTLSCPAGKSVLYLSAVFRDSSAFEKLNLSPEDLIRPYLNATLSHIRTTSGVNPNEHFSAFFARSTWSIACKQLQEHNVILCPSLLGHFAEDGDAATVCAEKLFWEVVTRLDDGRKEKVDTFWPPLQPDVDNEGDSW